MILYGAKPLGLPLRRSGCLAQYYPGNLVAPIGPCRFLYPLFKTSPKIPRFQSSLNMPTKKTYAKKQKVSKFLYPISITATGSAAQSYFLATYPCSIGGCQLTFGQLSSDPAQDGYYYALMVVRQGNPTPTLNITTATNPLVAPERDVFLQGFWCPGQANVISTKTRRVLQQGDELVLVVETNNANEVVVGTVQFFSFV